MAVCRSIHVGSFAHRVVVKPLNCSLTFSDSVYFYDQIVDPGQPQPAFYALCFSFGPCQVNSRSSMKYTTAESKANMTSVRKADSECGLDRRARWSLRIGTGCAKRFWLRLFRYIRYGSDRSNSYIHFSACWSLIYCLCTVRSGAIIQSMSSMSIELVALRCLHLIFIGIDISRTHSIQNFSDLRIRCSCERQCYPCLSHGTRTSA